MESIKYLSEMERYEIININDGDKYNFLGNNDIIVDNNGVFKLLILSENKPSFNLFKNNGLIEVSWDYVRKIGSKTIIIDIDDDTLRRSHI